MYHVSAQGVGERMINVHYYYCLDDFFLLVVIIHVRLGSISLPDFKRIAIKLKEI